ncbi:MAG: bifunctional phosphopantothenoylcysteine decarboxylase/phosphopantothenate--cysteine ligase CoaBC [Deltaproteobacteria bacterium]|nr:bifunctional phosphopantothenoylcysteine decarboxylase/phosphopantothenate--cysteine ligase CoaBC [Deltaproteobacteria bacterium]
MLEGKKIHLVVSGGVAAYKACHLARLFVKAGSRVRTSITKAGARFSTPLAFEALTGEKCVRSMWERDSPEIEHVSWASWADLLVVAPATADFIARAAGGLASDFSLATLLAGARPTLFAPAMNSRMYQNPATQRNLQTLKDLGHGVIEPDFGLLACGDLGLGRMPEPEEILFRAAKVLAPPILLGKKILITGGSTRENWDSVRFLANRSTGRMAAALAEAAWLMGAKVSLILGPSAVSPQIKDPALEVSRVESATDLLKAVEDALKGQDALFMAAAPADFRPEKRIEGKIKKTDPATPLSLPLARNPDILKTIHPQKDKNTILVGFNADQEELLAERALKKLKEKNLDYIVSNPATGPNSSFASDDTSFSLTKKGGRLLCKGESSKFAAAWIILRLVFSEPSF